MLTIAGNHSGILGWGCEGTILLLQEQCAASMGKQTVADHEWNNHQCNGSPDLLEPSVDGAVNVGLGVT